MILEKIQSFFPKVKKIVDAKKPASIEVTEKDCASKGLKDHTECAMAVACKRKFHLDGVIISRSLAYLVKGEQARRFLLPPSVSREIVSFDRGAGFAPGSYRLSAMTPGKIMGVKQSYSRQERNKPDDKRRMRHITANVRGVLAGKEAE